MSNSMIEAGAYKQISASANVSAVPATLLRIFVSAASATPTLTVYDSASTGTGTKIIDTFTPVSATVYTFNATATAGLYVVIGGTVSCTVIFA